MNPLFQQSNIKDWNKKIMRLLYNPIEKKLKCKILKII